MFLLGGLPRSGITVLSSILNQNPDVHVTTTSPFIEVLWRNYSLWDDPAYAGDLGTSKFQSMKLPFLNNITSGFYKEITDKPIILDKRRQWQGITNIKMFKDIYGELPKILCPVRDVDEIIVSYMQLYKQKGVEWDYAKLMAGNRFETSFYQLKETLASEYAECIHLIEYTDLVNDLSGTMSKVYEFLGINDFKHNSSTNSSEEEGDHGIKGLHNIRTTLSKDTVDTLDYLTDEQRSRYNEMIFWRN